MDCVEESVCCCMSVELGSVFGVKFLLVSLFWPGSISHSGLI